MFTRSVSFVVACFVVAPAVFGQAGEPVPGTPNTADRQWIARRAKFICDAYGLQGKQAERVTAMMIERVDAQRAREENTAMTIHSLSGALRQLPNEPISEALRSTLRRKFQRQMYDIYREAPLSYANILRRVEADLSKAQIAAAHERLKQQVSGRLAALGVELGEAVVGAFGLCGDVAEVVEGVVAGCVFGDDDVQAAGAFDGFDVAGVDADDEFAGGHSEESGCVGERCSVSNHTDHCKGSFLSCGVELTEFPTR